MGFLRVFKYERLVDCIEFFREVVDLFGDGRDEWFGRFVLVLRFILWRGFIWDFVGGVDF